MPVTPYRYEVQPEIRDKQDSSRRASVGATARFLGKGLDDDQQ
jgi:hypothetical protein